MTRQRILFAAEDQTSYDALTPVAHQLASEVEVEFLLFDSLLTESNFDTDVDPVDEFTHRSVNDFITTPINFFATAYDAGTDPVRAALQKVLCDNLPSTLLYRFEDLFNEVEPDLFVSAVDQFPVLRNLISFASKRGVPTVTIQHGSYYGPLQPSSLTDRRFFPSFDYHATRIERVKRGLFFRYGTQFCHPEVDLLLTPGTFFADRIESMRREYQQLSTRDFRSTTVRSSGLPEYDGTFQPYESSEFESVLFLSQQHYEKGEWTWEQQRELVALLDRLASITSVTVRPHPKDSKRKVSFFEEHFDVSSQLSLAADVRRADSVIGINSTALYEAVLRGVPTGILQLPWYPVDFKPFTHDHLLQITPKMLNRIPEISTEAARRSRETQLDYLSAFCYTPTVHPECEAESSTKLITQSLLDQVRSSS